jgi:hypothetical protein
VEHGLSDSDSDCTSLHHIQSPRCRPVATGRFLEPAFQLLITRSLGPTRPPLRWLIRWQDGVLAHHDEDRRMLAEDMTSKLSEI